MKKILLRLIAVIAGRLGFGTAFLFCVAAWSQTAYEAAAAQVRQGKHAAAIQVLEKILATSPADLKARNLLGIALLNSSRPEDACAEFQKALKIDPGFQPALKNLALAEVALGRHREARLHLEQAVKGAPDDAIVHFHLGTLYASEGRHADAVVHLEKAQQYPDRYAAGFNLMLAYLNSGSAAAAARVGEQLRAAGHNKAELHNLLSRAYEDGGRTQEAYDGLREATRIAPGDERNYVDLMSLCLKHENRELSMEISEIALRMVPNSWRVRLLRGAVFALSGRLEDAENEFLTATRLAPGTSTAVVSLALVRIEMNKLAEAAEELRQHRKRASSNYLVHWWLAEAISRQDAGDEARIEALDSVRQAVRLKPDAAAPRALLAKLLAKGGDLTGAAREFEAALKLDPEDFSAAYQLAVIYRKTGNSKRAEELMETVAKATAGDAPASPRRDLVRIVREGAR